MRKLGIIMLIIGIICMGVGIFYTVQDLIFYTTLTPIVVK